ncbi:MAG: ATP-binding protein [Bacteroidaceae bacterium]|nr:ATP-binding protein [Bacteroidaceae bacterium]
MEIKRDIHLRRLIKSKHNGMIKVVTGIRRCGKSYLLMNLFRQHLLDEGVSEHHIIMLDLEDRRNKKLRNPDALLEWIDSQIEEHKGTGVVPREAWYYVILDEIQLVAEFEDVLNSYLKIRNVDVYVTGSNSRFLSKDVITEFRGRGHEIHVTPLSMYEYVGAHPELAFEEALNQYMTYGGLPRVCLETDIREKEAYLKGLFEKTYLTDIQERYHIKGSDVMSELIDVIASGIGGLTNPMKIENTFKTVKGIGVGKNTIKQYLEMLEDSFLVRKAVRYDVKGRKYIATPQKYYFEDLGLRNARIGFRQVEMTHLMENMVYNELCLHGYTVDVGVVEYNTKDVEGASQRVQMEVDFVCNRGPERIYVQSAYALPDREKMEQEQASLLHIKDGFKKVIIVADRYLSGYNNDGIRILSLKHFLMEGLPAD